MAVTLIVSLFLLALAAPSAAAVKLQRMEVEPSGHARVVWDMPDTLVFARLVVTPESPGSPIEPHDVHGLFGGGGGFSWEARHIPLKESARTLRTPLPLAPGRYKIRLGAVPASSRDDPFAQITWSDVGELTVTKAPAQAQTARPATPSVAGEKLPPGIKAIRVGHAQRTRDDRGEHCSVKVADASVLSYGVREVTFTVELEPGVPQSLGYTIKGPGPILGRGLGCSAYGICNGQVCQTQYGWTNSRTDGQPLQRGTYKLVINVDGKPVERTFTVR